MKKIHLCFAVFACAAIFTSVSCSKKSSGPVTTANVMFVNGCAGADNVDVTVNSLKLQNATSMAFLANSGYQQITAGTSVNVAFLLTSTQTNVSTNTIDITAGSNYSVFASGLITGPSFVFTSDDLTAPSSGYAKVRFVDLCSDNLNESFTVGSATLDSNISYKTATAYSSVVAGTYTVKAGDPSNIASVVSLSSNKQFVAGKIYTVVLTGTLGGSANAALALSVIQNN